MMPDYHMHTYLCQHAQGTPADYLIEAEARAMPEICFTDHMPSPDGYDPDSRMSMEQYPTYRALLEPLRSTRTQIRVGIEADYYPGCERFLAGWLTREPFDIVIGSIHYIADWGFDNPRYADRWKTVDVTAVWQSYFSLVGALADTGLFDVVGHLDVPKRFGFRPPDAVVATIAAPALDRIADRGMAIEINTSGLRRPVKEIYPSPGLLRMARARGIPIVFGSDAHAPHEVGWAFDQALTLARDAGYTETLRFARRVRSIVPLP